jgi:CubicO group peptidase (beta-lactamase class C family)/uncharacterized protein (DUF2164 family)
LREGISVADSIYYPTRSWKESLLEKQDIDPGIFEKMLNAIKEDFRHVNSILAIKNGSIIFEKYFNGYNKYSLQNTACIFKSFISAAVGTALNKNIIGSLDERIADIFKNQVPDPIDENIRKITLKHALTNSTGLNWRPPEYYSNPDNLIYDDIRLAFELDVISEPGRVFSYKPDPQILVYSLSHLSGEDFIKYVDANLFRPMGIVDYQWDPGFNTIEDLRLTARDIAKLGYLYLCNGTWEDKTLISNDYIAESTMPQIWADYPEQGDFGYLWWISELHGNKVYYSSGFGGQYLYVIPRYDMIVVVTSRMDKPHPENKLIVRNLIEDISVSNKNAVTRRGWPVEKSLFSHYNLTKEDKGRLLDEIRNYFYQERDEQIGYIASESLLEFFLNTLGKYIYNKALDDVRTWFEKWMEDLESDFYAIYK